MMKILCWGMRILYGLLRELISFAHPLSHTYCSLHFPWKCTNLNLWRRSFSLAHNEASPIACLYQL